MNEPTDNSEEDAEEDVASGPLAGERLAEARRAQQIAVVEIAKELHLDEYKVRALERNDFDIIGAPVFAKGHLRKYAQLVQVSQEDVMADYYQLERSPGTPLLLKARRRPSQEISPLPWIAAIAVIAAVVAAYWWFAIRDNAPLDTNAPSVVAPQQRSIDETAEVVDGAPDDVASARSDDVATLDEFASVEVEAVATDESPISLQPAPFAAVVPVATDQLTLSVNYSGDCWTEITDANGRRLFFGLGTSGRSINLSGVAPFNVLFGDAANVSLEVNGAPFEIPVASRRGRTAKLTITGS